MSPCAPCAKPRVIGTLPHPVSHHSQGELKYAQSLEGRTVRCARIPHSSATAYTQASIAGAVRDTSGGVLPGVTVEAASPALIEGTRSATTDGAGQYRIIDLRPGTYTVTFSLPGFNTVRRDGIELTGSFAATINIEMGVGTLEETVTVTGDSPIVDVQSAQTEQRMDSETLATIPTGRQS